MNSKEFQTLLNNNSIEPFSLNLKLIETKIKKAERLYDFSHKNQYFRGCFLNI